MAGDEDQAVQIRQLRERMGRQASDIERLRKTAREAEGHSLFRLWGAALLLALFATTVGGWLVVPVYSTSNTYSPEAVDSFGLWNVFGSLNETVGGQAGVTIALLLLLLALGMSALSVPSATRLAFAGGCAVLLLASEIWLRIGISGQVAAQIPASSPSFDSNGFTNKYAYGGGSLTIALILTFAITFGAFNQALSFRRRAD